MIAEMIADPVFAVENLMNELFQSVFSNDAAREYLGFSNISQSSTDEGFPLWYLWFSDADGAYGLTIQDECRITHERNGNSGEAEESPILGARLLVRYYPAVDEKLFETLSSHEQLVRTGDLFDETGTPSFDGRQSIPEGYYVAGWIEIVLNASRSHVDFFCIAPDRWRDYRKDGLILPEAKSGSGLQLLPGDLDRDFPGWDASFFVFDKLISAHCFLTARYPTRISYATKPSAHYLIDEQQRVEVVPDASLTDKMLGISLGEAINQAEKSEQPSCFAKIFQSHQHQMVSTWTTPEATPEFLKNQNWWLIGKMHFHNDTDHLCSCYHDH